MARLFFMAVKLTVKRGVLAFLALVLAGAGIAFWRLPVSVAYGFIGGDIGARLAGIALADEGWEIAVFAEGVESARQIAPGGEGWIFVGSRAGSVYALRDADGDGKAETKRIILRGLRAPHGVAFHKGDLYIGEIPRVLVVRGVLGKLRGGEKMRAEVFVRGFPESGHHGLRHIKAGPDDMLYVSLGVPCNICLPPEDELAGVIRRYPLSARAPMLAGEGEVYARGLRNAVGFAWHPHSKVLWITDNGRDWLGDDLPDDELNRAPKKGMHFGFPYCHQGDLPDPEFGDEGDCKDYEPPALLTGAHVANLGMDFTAAGDALIALHGSWNRSVKVGYAVRRARIDDGRVAEYENFAEGWLLPDGGVWGRPADVAVLPDESVLVSDDYADAIYRIAKKEKKQ